MKRNTKLAGLGRALTHINGGAFGSAMAGYDVYGSTYKATLFVGLTTGLDTNGKRDGQKIDPDKIEEEVIVTRIHQIGVKNASSTTVMAKGRYQGSAEDSLKIDIAFTMPDREPTGEKFESNVRQLAETLAGKFGQREVLIEWTKPKEARAMKGGKRGKSIAESVTEISTATASPPDAPSPTSDGFCAWVRQNSTSARTDPKDACYAPGADLTGAKRRRKK